MKLWWNGELYANYTPNKWLNKNIERFSYLFEFYNIYFNDNLVNLNSFEDYIKLYVTEYFYETNKDKTWSIAIALSENGFQQISFANSTETYDGGTHVDYIMNQIVVELREFFVKKHKVDIKPSELKQHMLSIHHSLHKQKRNLLQRLKILVVHLKLVKN